jgi:hypothetical protein
MKEGSASEGRGSEGARIKKRSVNEARRKRLRHCANEARMEGGSAKEGRKHELSANEERERE